MPRQPRLDAPGTLHHVMIRGIDGIKIFRDDQDHNDFLSRFSRLVDKTGARIIAWALLTNHVHLLMFSGHQGVSSFMRSLLTGYAINFNRKYRRSGHLFQNRYKSIVCEQEPYLLELVRYIHLNPLRAKIVKTIDALDRYRWSGHGVLIGKRKFEWQERNFVLGHFAKDKRRAIRAYRKFIEEGKSLGSRPELVGGGLIRSLGGWSQVSSLRGKGEKVEHDARILGGGDFVSEILQEADKKLKRQLNSGERQKAINQVIQSACAEAGVSEEELRGGGQRRKVSGVRAKVAYQLTREFGIPMAEVARQVGVCTSAVIKAIHRLEMRHEKS